MLCRCSCHRTCPLAHRTAGVPVTVWRRRCTCPGAEEARTMQRDPSDTLPGPAEFWEPYLSKLRQVSEARKDALKATRSAAPGKTRDEIRDLYIAELRARGLEIPSERDLAIAIDMLSGDARAWLREVRRWVRREFLRG